jgi:Ca2+-binding RTX toxin-like protein
MSSKQTIVESLETRTLMSATLADGLLTVTGTDAAETIRVEQEGSRIYAYVGDVRDSFRASRVQTIRVDALGGDDTVQIEVKRNSRIQGGAGDDTISGGSGHDTIDGDQGTDVMFGNKGSDTNVWDPGDGSDVVEGGKGFDALLFNGSDGAEIMDASANGDRLKFFRNLGNINIDAGSTERLIVIAKGGADQITNNDLTGTPVTHVEVDAGDGDDVVNGGNLSETLFGGAGNDTIDGNKGDDAMLGGDGDDLLIWDPGDGSDLNNGGNGDDVLRFNGSNGDEVMTMSTIARNQRTIFTRDLGNIRLDVRKIETVDVEAKGGADKMIISDLSAGTVRTVNVDLESATGTNTPDDRADFVQVLGTSAADTVTVTGAAGGPATVAGLAATVKVANSSATDDLLAVSGLAGNDVIDASALQAGVVKVMNLSGDGGNDSLLGSRGVDEMFGGNQHDFADGNQGDDRAVMGGGDDLFVWDSGDGSDVVEGRAGADLFRFNGSNGNEVMNAQADGGRMKFFRDLGNINMDVAAFEEMEVFALGGDDEITIGDLSGTGIGAVFANGGAGSDTIIRSSANGIVTAVEFETEKQEK